MKSTSTQSVSIKSYNNLEISKAKNASSKGFFKNTLKASLHLLIIFFKDFTINDFFFYLFFFFETMDLISKRFDKSAHLLCEG